MNVIISVGPRVQLIPPLSWAVKILFVESHFAQEVVFAEPVVVHSIYNYFISLHDRSATARKKPSAGESSKIAVKK